MKLERKLFSSFSLSFPLQYCGKINMQHTDKPVDFRISSAVVDRGVAPMGHNASRVNSIVDEKETYLKKKSHCPYYLQLVWLVE